MWRGMLLLFALVLLGAGKPHPQQAKQAQTQQQVQGAPIAAEYAPYPQWSTDACYKAKNHDTADLCAQWRAAIASEKSAHEARRATTWSIVATIFSVFAFGVLIWSLVQTERSLGETRRANVMNMRENARSTRRAVAAAEETAAALDAARKTAEAAAGQVEIAQETAYRQLRAYLSIEDVAINEVSDDFIYGHLTIRNAGRTPATVRLYVATDILPHLVEELPTGSPEPTPWPTLAPYISARSAETVSWYYPVKVLVSADVAKAEIQKLIADPVGLSIHLFGRIEFLDFQRHQRVLSFNYRQAGHIDISKEKREMVAAIFGNHYEDRGIQEA